MGALKQGKHYIVRGSVPLRLGLGNIVLNNYDQGLSMNACSIFVVALSEDWCKYL